MARTDSDLNGRAVSDWTPTAWRRRVIDDTSMEVRDVEDGFVVSHVPVLRQGLRMPQPEQIGIVASLAEGKTLAERWVSRHAYEWRD